LLPTTGGNIVTFSAVNHLAIAIAAIMAWLASAAWYMSLSGLYTAALGKTPQQMAEDRKKPGAFLPYVYALVANVIIAWMLAGLLAHLGVGQVTLRNGIISAVFLWFGFVLTTMTVNYSFSGRDRRLLRRRRRGGHSRRRRWWWHERWRLKPTTKVLNMPGGYW